MMAATAEPDWLLAEPTASDYRLTLCGNGASLRLALAEFQPFNPKPLVQQQGNDTAWQGMVECDAKIAAELLASVRQKFAPIDVWIEPMDCPPRSLLICDMDMTIVASETLDEVATILGKGAEVSAITAKAMQGELDFKQALDQRVGMLAGHDVAVFDQVLQRTQLDPGASALLSAAKAAKMHCILVSGGFSQVAEPIARQLGFDEVYCNQLELDQGVITGGIKQPIVDAWFKRDLLTRRANELGIELANCCAIGDGANDLLMLTTAGLGIAYHAKPLVRDASSCQINHTDLTSAVYFLGLKPAALKE